MFWGLLGAPMMTAPTFAVDVNALRVVLDDIIVPAVATSQTTITTPTDIVLGDPIVEAAAVEQTYVILATDLLIDAPIVSPALPTQTTIITPAALLLGEPVVTEADVDQEFVIGADKLALRLNLRADWAFVTQTYNLVTADIVLRPIDLTVTLTDNWAMCQTTASEWGACALADTRWGRS